MTGGQAAVVEPIYKEPSKTMVIEEAFLTEKQTADFLGTKVSTLRNWSALRKGPPRIKVGRTAMYRREALVGWLESRERHHDAPTRGRGRPKKPAA